jgi:hypothetical protein
MDFTSVFPTLLQLGSTGAVIFVVLVFLAHIKEESKLSREAHVSCSEKMMDVVKENTRGFAELREIVRSKVA